jgi:hypothetical protein
VNPNERVLFVVLGLKDKRFLDYLDDDREMLSETVGQL